MKTDPKMVLPGGTPTSDTPFIFPSLAPMDAPDATERTFSIPSPSKIQKVGKEKEEFEERCNPFFDTALDQLEAEQVKTPSSHLQQKIEEIHSLYEASIYSDLAEDLNEILSNIQAHEDNDDNKFEIFVRQFYATKENELLALLQAALTSTRSATAPAPARKTTSSSFVSSSPNATTTNDNTEKVKTIVAISLNPNRLLLLPSVLLFQYQKT